MKKIVIGIVCIILVVLLCITFSKNGNIQNEVNNTVNKVENVVNETKNEVTNVANDVLEDDKKENTVSNSNEVVTLEPSVSNNNIYEQNSDVGTTDKKQEAIDLVKAEWGEDSTVSYRCDSVTSNGEYIIAVVSKETTAVKNYFRVNLAQKTVEVDY